MKKFIIKEYSTHNEFVEIRLYVDAYSVKFDEDADEEERGDYIARYSCAKASDGGTNGDWGHYGNWERLYENEYGEIKIPERWLE